VFAALRRPRLRCCWEFTALKRAHRDDLPTTHTVILAGQSVDLPVATVLRVVAIVGSLLIACDRRGDGCPVAVAGAVVVSPRTGGAGDPIFGRPLDFYLFTLPRGRLWWAG